MKLPAPQGRVWVDGAARFAADATVALGDPAVQSGLGLFETLARTAEGVLDLEAHLARLGAGADRLGFEAPPASDARGTILAAAGQLAGPGWVKLLLSASGRWFVYAGESDPVPQPARAVVLPWRRNPTDPLSGLKSLNYAASGLGLAWARRAGADEGLWRNTRGHLTEGCTTNLFLVRGSRVHTARRRDGILPGIVRDVVLAACDGAGLVVHRGRVRVELLRRADEAFLTSSLVGVRPLVAVDRRPIGRGLPGPVTGRLAEKCDRLRPVTRVPARLSEDPG